MKKSATIPKISVCIPVFETEVYLTQCLRSAYTQDFCDFEIVVVSDASRGRDGKGRSAKKIVKIAQKEAKNWRKEKNLPPVPIRFVEQHENRGILEVRRTLVYESKGEYLYQLDSDDELTEGALTALWAVAKIPADAIARLRTSAGMTAPEKADSLGAETNETTVSLSDSVVEPCRNMTRQSLDIVHGDYDEGVFDSDGKFVPSGKKRFANFIGELTNHDIFRAWLVENKFSGNNGGKLIKRELWLKAYEQIPYTECNMADDVLLFFFIAQNAKSYIGIEAKVYRYRVTSGMSSARKIDTMHKWKMVCSSASVFSVIAEWIKENPLQNDETEKIRMLTRFYLSSNLKQMRERVAPELHLDARAMLCEYWGSDFVEKMESIFDNGKEESHGK